MTFSSTNGIVEDISAEIGYTATTTLIDWLGGTSLYVPQFATEDHMIEKLIGPSAFRHLVDAFGNSILNLPIDYRRERTQRNRLIGALIAKGIGATEIAKISGISLKQIGHVRADLESAGLLPFVIGTYDLLMMDAESIIASVDEFDVVLQESVETHCSTCVQIRLLLKSSGVD